MSDTRNDDPETRRALEDFRRMLRQKSRQEREALLSQARDEALAEELEEARADSEREATALREALSRDDPREAAFRAREQAKSAALLLIMLFLILWLIAAATGRTDILRLPGGQPPVPTLQPRISTATAMVDLNPGPGRPAPPVGAAFREHYDLYGGPRIFGLPIGPEVEENGQHYQWFQRGLLKEFPQFKGSEWYIQGDLLGFRSTKDITFPAQAAFINTENARYFFETGHGLTDRFLKFWNDNNGLIVLGYPISEQILETLEDNQIHTVQYFERGRLEWHPEHANTPDEMQVGLLGQAIYTNKDWHKIISNVRPTPVPLPTPTPAPAP